MYFFFIVYEEMFPLALLFIFSLFSTLPPSNHFRPFFFFLLRVQTVRGRGGNLKYRALRLETGNFSWGTECMYSFALDFSF